MRSMCLAALMALPLLVTGTFVTGTGHDIALLEARVTALVAASLDDPAPGVAITVIHGGEVVWFGGYGAADKRKKSEVTEDTVFAIASISKSVAAWGFLRLVAAGQIGLDDPVTETLEGWSPRKRKDEQEGITLRRLLSHTAGLNVHGVESVRHGRPLPSLLDAIHGKPRGFRRVELEATPGMEYRYSGGGTSLAQLLFEELRGASFEEAMEREVLRPLGMKVSGFQWNEDRIAAAATPYMPSGRRTSYGDYPQAAPAAFVTSSREFARFVLACLPAHRPPVAEDVLPREYLEAMLAPSPEARHAGLGFFHKRIRGLSTVGHTGGDHGWTSVLRMVPARGDALFVFQNSFQAEPLSRRIEDLWADWVQGR